MIKRFDFFPFCFLLHAFMCEYVFPFLGKFNWDYGVSGWRKCVVHVWKWDFFFENLVGDLVFLVGGKMCEKKIEFGVLERRTCCIFDWFLGLIFSFSFWDFIEMFGNIMQNWRDVALIIFSNTWVWKIGNCSVEKFLGKKFASAKRDKMKEIAFASAKLDFFFFWRGGGGWK